jgi:hypothetical protein
MKSSSRTNYTRDAMKQLVDQNVHHHVDHVGFCTNSFKNLHKTQAKPICWCSESETRVLFVNWDFS